jgi:hypothetical protein
MYAHATVRNKRSFICSRNHHCGAHAPRTEITDELLQTKKEVSIANRFR